jgi:AraC family transcriptional regulator, positive regulator of tynA and feaB
VALVLDSQTIPERDRVAALNAAFSSSEVPQSVTYETDGPVRHRMDLFSLGPGAHLLRNTGTGLRILRGPGHVRMGAPEQLAVFIQTFGYGLLSADGDHFITGTGRLGMLDTTRPYSYRQPGDSKHKVLLIDSSQLGLPMDVIRSAAPSLGASPLYELVQAHFARLYEQPAELPPDAAAMLGRATVQLVRALIATAADDVRQYEALHATLFLRITMYIDAHLHDRELNTDRIAAAHHISSRQLYNLWARAGYDLTPSQWIIQRRLERARNQLTDLDPQLTSVAAIAHGCGFRNMSHFSRRFREAYGISAREWRSASRGDAQGN